MSDTINKDDRLKDFANSNSFSDHNFHDIEVTSLWNEINSGSGSLQKTQYDSNIQEHKEFLTAVIYKILDSHTQKGHKDNYKDTKYTESDYQNGNDFDNALTDDIIGLIIAEALEVATAEYGTPSLSNMENAILTVMEGYDNDCDDNDTNDCNPNKGNADNVGDTGDTGDAGDAGDTGDTGDAGDAGDTGAGNPNNTDTFYDKSTLGDEIYSKKITNDEHKLSQEVLNETADSYFDNVLTDRQNTILDRFYTSTEYADKELSDLDDFSREILQLKYALKQTIGTADYDDDTANIIIQVARKNLASNTSATLSDLYTQVENIMQGDSANFTDNDTNDTNDARNISADFGSIDNLFDALCNKTPDPTTFIYDQTMGYNSFTTNETLDKDTIKAFLEGYFNDMPESYIDELLVKAIELDTNGNAFFINRDEFKAILKKIDDDLGGSKLGLDRTITNSTITDMTENLDGYNLEQSNGTTTGSILNLTTTKSEYTDYRLSQQLSSKMIDTYFADKFPKDRDEQEFNVPTVINADTKLSDLTDTDNIIFSIKEQLMTNIGTSLDMTEIIVKNAMMQLETQPDATVQDLCNEIEGLITKSPITTKEYEEPNIEQDFGSIQNLFSVLTNSSYSKYDTETENLETLSDTYLDKDVLISFLSSYAYLEVDTNDIPEIINIVEFYAYLGEINKTNALNLSQEDTDIINSFIPNLDDTATDTTTKTLEDAVTAVTNEIGSNNEYLVRNILSSVSESTEDILNPITQDHIDATKAIALAIINGATTDGTVIVNNTEYSITVNGTEYTYDYDRSNF